MVDARPRTLSSTPHSAQSSNHYPARWSRKRTKPLKHVLLRCLQCCVKMTFTLSLLKWAFSLERYRPTLHGIFCLLPMQHGNAKTDFCDTSSARRRFPICSKPPQREARKWRKSSFRNIVSGGHVFNSQSFPKGILTILNCICSCIFTILS